MQPAASGFVRAPMPSVDTPSIRLLDSARPLSDAICEALVAGHAGEPFDFARTMLLVPGGRIVPAIERNLLGRARSAGAPLVAPSIVTPLMFASRFFEPARPVLAASAARLSWREAIEASLAARDGLALRVASAFGAAPTEDEFDVTARARLAQRMQRLASEAAAAMHDFASLASSAAARARPEVAARIAVLAELAATRDAVLAKAGVADRDDALREAVREGRISAEGLDRVVVLLADPEPVQRAILARLRELGVAVEACVHTRESVDPQGFPILGEWENRAFSVARLPDRAIRTAPGPRESAAEAIAAIRALGATPASDELAIVAPDAEFKLEVERALDLAGSPPAKGESRAFAATRIGTLLSRLQALLGEGTAESLASFVRHDDAANWLRREHRIEDAATAVVDYRADTLVGRWNDEVVRDSREAAAFALVRAAVEALVAPLGGRHPAREWARPIREAVRRVVGDDLRGAFAAERAGSVRLLDRALRELAEIPAAFATPLACDEAVALVLGDAARREIRGERADDGVSIIGWLDAGIADERHLVFVGCADGMVPQGASADGAIPDEVRRACGLPSGMRHAARDAWILDGILARAAARGAEASVAFIVPARTAEGDPLKPSRFLLRVEGADLPARVARLFPAEHAAAPSRDGQGQGGAAEFPVTPAVAGTRIESLRVTAFRTYLECPYLFQLRFDPRLGLERADERASELNAAQFGTLVHAALERWGRDEAARVQPTASAAAIERDVCGYLDEHVRARFPASRPAALKVQVEIARARLRRFAALQAAEADAGWRVRHVELSFERAPRAGAMQAPRLPAEDGIHLTGRIDRVDERDGVFRALDYKTSNSAKSPTVAHLKRGKASDEQRLRWLDLQLPLYRVLLRSLPMPILVGASQLGFVNLAPSADRSGFHFLEITDEELDLAEAAAGEIVGAIRRGEFTPSKRVPIRSEDPLAPIWGQGLRFADAAGGDE